MKIKIGNIFESECSTIVNTINCVGVMGKGIALEFKKRYPEMYINYVRRCDEGNVKIGEPYVYEGKDGKKILNFPTKDHWRSPSRLSYVIKGLDWFVNNYEKEHIDSIAFPPLGCGNGGLAWEVVGPIMYQKLRELPINIEIYAPFGTNINQLSEEYLSKSVCVDEVNGKQNLKMNTKWYLILQVIRELNVRTYSLKVGRTIYQKICYSLTRNGVKTGFRFKKGAYGPYSEEAKESITVLANANLIVEKTLGKMVSLNVSDDVVIDEKDFTAEEWEAMKQTVDLFGRVKSTEQAEMITTVLFAYDELNKNNTIISDKKVFDFVMQWKPHWKVVKDYEVCDTIHNMAMLSLIKVEHSKELIDTILV